MSAANSKMARFVRDLDGFTGHASLYELSEPAAYGYGDDAGHTTFVVVSATNAIFSGPETYIFAADKKGKVKSWSEMEGSYRGDLDHAKALRGAGFTIEAGGQT